MYAAYVRKNGNTVVADLPNRNGAFFSDLRELLPSRAFNIHSLGLCVSVTDSEYFSLFLGLVHGHYQIVQDLTEIEFDHIEVNRNKKPAKLASNPRSVLFVTEHAPVEVVKAAYKALMLKHHPDRGGDPILAQSINEAYEEVMQSYG